MTLTTHADTKARAHTHSGWEGGEGGGKRQRQREDTNIHYDPGS